MLAIVVGRFQSRWRCHRDRGQGLVVFLLGPVVKYVTARLSDLVWVGLGFGGFESQGKLHHWRLLRRVR